MMLSERLPVVVQEAEALLSGYVCSLFYQAEAKLLKTASHSECRLEQRRSFAALREVRFQRESCLADFLKHLMSTCESVDHKDDKNLSSSLRINIVCETLVAKALSDWQADYQELVLSINRLIPMALQTCPFGPHRLCYAFVCSIDELSIHEQVKIDLLVMFDQVILAALGDIYSSLMAKLLDDEQVQSRANCNCVAPAADEAESAERLSQEDVLPKVQLSDAQSSEALEYDIESPLDPKTHDVSPAMHEPMHQNNGALPSDSAMPSVDLSRWLNRADQLVQGTWFEWIRSGEPVSRCKLAVVIPKVDSFVFVNRLGVKVATQSRLDVAAALQSGQLKIVEDSAFFDRSLQAVIGSWRRMKFS